MSEHLDPEIAETLTLLNELDVEELRNHCFTIGGTGPTPQPPYAHQLEAIRRIEAGALKDPPVSGILHYPTGAGKTRTALELIARGLAKDPDHLFVWATHSQNLLRQSMVRMVELARIFPADTEFGWARNADDIEQMAEDDIHLQVVFMTRNALTDVLERAADGRRRGHPWREHLEANRPLTLIYDECHQLGAAKLQKSWRKFYENVVCVSPHRRRRFRTIGLSATPVPTRVASHELLGECIFPRRDGPATAHGWPFHVFHRVPNATLLESGVLCPLNTSLDASGFFDIPADVLREVTGNVGLNPPGANADPVALQNYSLSFNARVMSDDRIVEFIADRIGSRLDVLGKTVVFTPNIATANRLAARIYHKFPSLRGRVAAVHSKMAEVHVPGQEEATVQDVLREFRDRGSQPSLLINVDMLTEGFDDPKIQTVVLARLTLSTNRFWQMIGRGTRGPACGGTNDCYVIDPVKLVRLYDYFGGYQPSMQGGPAVENEDGKAAEEGLDLLPPDVKVARRPPDPAICPYVIDPELARINAQVAAALADFLRPLPEAVVVEAARSAQIDLTEGRPVFRSADEFSSPTGTAVLLAQIAGLERRTGHELSWLRRSIPEPLDEILLRHQMRRLSAIERLGLWTQTDLARAEMSGDFQKILGQPAVPIGGVAPAPSATAQPPSVEPPAATVVLTPLERATVAAALELVAVEQPGQTRPPSYAQRLVILDTLRRLFGRTPDEALDQAVQAARRFADGSFAVLDALDPGQRQLLLSQLVHLATVDGPVTDPELGVLTRFAQGLQIPEKVAATLLGIDATRSPDGDSALVCRSCSFELPIGACFCPGCGSSIAAA